MSGNQVFKLISAASPWKPFVYADHEFGQGQILRDVGDGGAGLTAGLWRGVAADIPHAMYTYERNETIYIIKGRLRVDLEDGTHFEAGAGDAVSFDKGSTVALTILSDEFEEFFVFS